MHQDSNSQYDQALDQASEWIVKLRAPEVTELERVEFSRWLNSSNMHLRAFDEMMDLWGVMGDVDEQILVEPDKNEQEGNQPSLVSKILQMRSTGFITSLTAVAGVVLTITLLILPPSESSEFMEYKLLPGEDALVLLDDGTNIHLNTRSHVKITYTKDLRLVELLSGEAYFEVASNKSRPFVVNTGKGTVTAIGTAFNININRNNRIDTISVTEGMVRVKQKKDATTPYPASKFVKENFRTQLSSNGLTEVEKIDQTKTVEWLSQTITYKNSPIPVVLTELNRYLAEPVNFVPSTLNHLRVSGTFSTEAPEDTLDALLTSFDLSMAENREILAPDCTH